jgi:lipid II:glycine glycyltransferase (peptidoglycan interpeptide bridge formation enzyme)
MDTVLIRKKEQGYTIYHPFYISFLEIPVMKNLLTNKIGHIYQLLYQDEIMCSIFIIEYKDKAFAVYWGSSSSGYDKQVSVNLFWEILKKYVEKNIRFLNLGGLPKDESAEGIKVFKKTLGAKETVCTGGRLGKIQGPIFSLGYDLYIKYASSR